MKLTMSSGDNKETMNATYSSKEQMVDLPQTVVVSETDQRKFLTKKRIISAVVAVLIAAFVVTGILVGIWIFTEQSKMILQYKQNLISNDNSKANQEVSTDVAENIVQYHVVKEDNEWWIVEDFNKGIKMSKVKGSNGVYKCLASSLDEAIATKPSDVKAPSSPDQKAEDSVSASEMFTIAEDPVKDTSFLGKTAKKLCDGTPVHWTYRTCVNSTDVSTRDKRALASCTPCGCGYRVCLSCGTVYYYYTWSRGVWRCSWNIYYCARYGYSVYRC